MKKIKTKDFFVLKVWAKNMGAHYTWQNMVVITVLSTIVPIGFGK